MSLHEGIEGGAPTPKTIPHQDVDSAEDTAVSSSPHHRSSVVEQVIEPAVDFVEAVELEKRQVLKVCCFSFIV